MTVNGSLTGYDLSGAKSNPFQMFILDRTMVDAAFEFLRTNTVRSHRDTTNLPFMASAVFLRDAVMWGSNQRGWKFTRSDLVTIFPKA